MTTLITKCVVPPALVGILREALYDVLNERDVDNTKESTRCLAHLFECAVFAESDNKCMDISIVTWYIGPVIEWLSERERCMEGDGSRCAQLKMLLQPSWNDGILRPELI